MVNTSFSPPFLFYRILTFLDELGHRSINVFGPVLAEPGPEFKVEAEIFSIEDEPSPTFFELFEAARRR